MDSRYLGGFHVHANGIRQHILRYGGAGTPLLLVPGITSPAITWGFVAEELAATHDVHVLDVRGRGLSQSGSQIDYRLDACASDVNAVAEVLGWNDAALMGHSMGARHAIRACRIDGSRFGRVVLVDPPMSGPGRRPYPSKLPWYIDSMALARHGADLETLRAFTPTWTDEQIALRAQWLHTCDQAAILSSFASFHDDDVHADLPALRQPALLVSAEHGDVVRDVDADECIALAPALSHVRVLDAGHMIPWDNLPGFLAAVRPFLAA
ncbi:alpha/beta hydrolase [Sphingobium sp. H39-3-25]|uniref:alpha/beta fold hydrolase n=1 Tax=Sphingobium arseniciresistens TaxID=3030834 RepID=UPI0023B911E2|nr:alpha/beta hydrolase [Sphingobium arseniciresistens]